MKIALAADHGGYNLKQYLIESLQKDYQIIDLGTNSEESVDFPKYGILLGEKIAKKEADIGIAICKSGIGISIAVNKVKGAYCAKINTIEEASLAKKHNRVNVIAFSGKTDKEYALEMVHTFLNEKPLEEERYLRRINQIKEYENAS